MTVRYPQQDSTDLEEPAELTNAERCLADNGLQWDAIRCYRDRVNCEYEQAVSMVRAYVDNVVGHQ
jgi:hypothetical protein